MTVDSWDPNQPNTPPALTTSETRALLERFASLSANNRLEALNEELSATERKQNQLMFLDEEEWLPLLEGVTNATLLDLIRFFTIAEMQLSGWQAGEKSPVIVITRHLKRQGIKLDKSLLVWIKENSNNRFIPNGAIML